MRPAASRALVRRRHDDGDNATRSASSTLGMRPSRCRIVRMARSVLSNPAFGMQASIVGLFWWIVAQNGPSSGTFGSAFDAAFGTLDGMSELSTTRAVTLYV